MMDLNFIKKITATLIILLATLAVITPFSLNTDTALINVAHAQEDEGSGQEEDQPFFSLVPCGGTISPFSAYCQGAETAVAATKSVTTWTVNKFFQFIGFLLLFVAGVILWMAGTLLNIAINVSVVHMSSIIGSIGVLNEAWRVVRDLINMAFIFILLYISISTILGGWKDTQKTVVKLIVAALLINFSLFFTKIVIDSSNILALQFYSAIAPAHVASQQAGSTPGGWIQTIRDTDGGMSDIFADAVRVTATFNPQESVNSIDASNFGDNFDAEKLTDGNNYATIAIVGSVFLLILSFVLFTGAFLFIIRLVMLMLLMIASPIAFAGMMLPKFKNISSKWWKNLLDQAFFAPVFMIFMYLVALIVTSDGFKQMTVGENLSNAFVGQGNIVIILNFFIVIALALAAIVVSKSMMGSMARGGVNWATKTAGKLSFGTAGFLGRQFVGRGASALARSEAVQAAARRIPLGRQLYSGVQKVSKSSFDARSTGLGKGLASGAGVRIGSSGRKGGFVEYKEEKQKKIQQFEKDTDGVFEEKRRRIKKAKDAHDEAKDIRQEFEKDTISPLKEKVAEAQKKLDESNLPESKQIAKEELRQAKEELASEEKVLESKKKQEELAKEGVRAAERSLKEAQEQDPYLRKLEEGGLLARNIPPIGWARNTLNTANLIGQSDKDAAFEIRKWKNMNKQERLLEDLKRELKQNTKAEEDDTDEFTQKSPKEKDDSENNE